MVNIFPLKALHFSEELKKDIASLVSPPYDIISHSQKEELKKSHDYNIVNLILPESSEGRDRYENAAYLLKKMIEKDILTYDSDECLYVIEESFYDEGIWKSFRAFIGLNKIEEYDSFKVLRHEYTLSKPKEDRLNLLRHTHANFGLIYTLYNDEDNIIQNILDSHTDQEPYYDFTAGYDSSLKFKIWKVFKPETMKNIISNMNDKKLLIADGHHRYETSRIFMHEINEKRKAGEIKGKRTTTYSTNQSFFPEEAVLTLFVNYNQENIKILPTHRMIKFKKNFNLKDNFKKIEKYFSIKKYEDIFNNKPEYYKNENIQLLSINIEEFMNNEKRKKHHSFCLINKQQEIFFLILKKPLSEIYNDVDKSSYDFENLDVRILHRLFLEDIVGNDFIDKIDYTHTYKELLSELFIKKGKYDIAIILNPPEIKDVQKISNKGKVMPQKSTYFYPKPCSGLIMYKMQL